MPLYKICLRHMEEIMRFIGTKKSKQIAAMIAMITIIIIVGIIIGSRGSYLSQKRAYCWERYQLELNDAGEFCLLDFLTSSYWDYIRYGTYRVRFHKIILDFDDGKRMVFYQEDDQLVFMINGSKGMEEYYPGIEDKSTWMQSDIFFKFKD